MQAPRTTRSLARPFSSLSPSVIPMPVVTLASALGPPAAAGEDEEEGTAERAAGENDHRSIPDGFLRPTVICNIFLLVERVHARARARSPPTSARTTTMTTSFPDRPSVRLPTKGAPDQIDPST